MRLRALARQLQTGSRIGETVRHRRPHDRGQAPPCRRRHAGSGRGRECGQDRGRTVASTAQRTAGSWFWTGLPLAREPPVSARGEPDDRVWRRAASAAPELFSTATHPPERGHPRVPRSPRGATETSGTWRRRVAKERLGARRAAGTEVAAWSAAAVASATVSAVGSSSAGRAAPALAQWIPSSRHSTAVLAAPGSPVTAAMISLASRAGAVATLFCLRTASSACVAAAAGSRRRGSCRGDPAPESGKADRRQGAGRAPARVRGEGVARPESAGCGPCTSSTVSAAISARVRHRAAAGRLATGGCHHFTQRVGGHQRASRS